MKRRATKSVTFRTTPEQLAHVPELCRLHGGVPLSRILRKLLDAELVRLRLTDAPQALRVRGRRRSAI